MSCEHTILALLLLLVGVSSLYINPNETQEETLQPIVSRSQSRRICSELCTSGLGGAGCGVDCLDLVPPGLPILQYDATEDSANKNVAQSSRPRQSPCSILCRNGLGVPLCPCNATTTGTVSTNFVEVCSFYCTEFDYRIYGCQKCTVYNSTGTTTFSNQSLLSNKQPTVDWDQWCMEMCQKGDGGAACNCDILPMSIKIAAN